MFFPHPVIPATRRARVATVVSGIAVASLVASLAPAAGAVAAPSPVAAAVTVSAPVSAGAPARAAVPGAVRSLATTTLSGVVVGAGVAALPALPSALAQRGNRKPRSQRFWRFVASDQFNRLDPGRWGKFEGRPGCCPDAWWDPSMVKINKGKLLLHTQSRGGRMVSGGVGGWHWEQGVRKYGRWDARIRFDRGQGVSAAALLWPTDNGWPPELDFYEIFETWGARDEMMVTTHWRAQGEHRYSQRTVRRDFTKWHVASVRWTPNHIAYVLDGRRIKVDRNKPKIPRTPMWVGFQTHAHRMNGRYPAMPAGKDTVALAVDWVKVYKRNR